MVARSEKPVGNVFLGPAHVPHGWNCGEEGFSPGELRVAGTGRGRAVAEWHTQAF